MPFQIKLMAEKCSRINDLRDFGKKTRVFIGPGGKVNQGNCCVVQEKMAMITAVDYFCEFITTIVTLFTFCRSQAGSTTISQSKGFSLFVLQLATVAALMGTFRKPGVFWM